MNKSSDIDRMERIEGFISRLNSVRKDLVCQRDIMGYDDGSGECVEDDMLAINQQLKFIDALMGEAEFHLASLKEGKMVDLRREWQEIISS